MAAQSNRTLVYGAIAVVVALLLIWMFAGGNAPAPAQTTPGTPDRGAGFECWGWNRTAARLRFRPG